MSLERNQDNGKRLTPNRDTEVYKAQQLTLHAHR